MSLETFTKRSRIPAPAEAVYRWHWEPGALERLTPPGERLRIVARTGGMEDGARVAFRIGPFGVLWVAEHRDTVFGRQFRDVQIRGPFPRWEHLHRFLPDGPNACFLLDEIVYELPFGTLGSMFAGRYVRRKLDRVFAWRHKVTLEAFQPGASMQSRGR